MTPSGSTVVRLLRRAGWAAAVAFWAPLALGLSPGPSELSLPEVVVRGIDQVRLTAHRRGVVALEPARLVEAATPVALPPAPLPSPDLVPAPEVKSPGCAYRGAAGAVTRAFQGAEGLYRSAMDSLARGALDEAAGYLADLRQRFPGDRRAGDAAFWLGEIRRRQGRTADALAFFRLVQGPLAAEAVYRRAWLLTREGRTAEARRAWQAVADELANPHRPEALYRLGVARLEAGEPGAAADRFRGVLAAGEGGATVSEDLDAAARLALGLALRRAGDPAGAETALVRFLLDHPDHPSAAEAQLALAWTLLDQGKPREAARRFQWVLDAGPGPEIATRARFGLVRARADLGDAEGARQALAALEAGNPLGPWVGWARAELGWLAVRQGRPADALERYRSARDAWLGPGEDVVQYMEAESLYLLDRYGEAADAFERVPEDSALRAAGLHRAGVCALLAGDPGRAERLLRAVLDHHPTYRDRDRVRVWLGEALVRQGRPDAARRAYEAVPEGSPAGGAALYGLAWLAFEAGRWDEAAAKFDRFLNAYPDDPNRDEGRLTLARAHFNRRELRAALEALASLEQQAADPRYRSAARFHRGWMMARSGQDTAARAVLGSLVAREPDGPYTTRALSTLGWLDFGQGRYEAALERFEAVAERDPDGPLGAEARQKKADALYNLGQYEEALEAYRALGATAEAAYGAALCLVQLQRYDALEAEVDRFVRDHPDDPRRADLLLALAQARAARGDPAGAAEAYDRAARAAGDDRRAAEARLDAARNRLAAGAVDRARTELEALAERPDPVGLAALSSLARLLEEHGTKDEVRATWDLVASRLEGTERARALREAARWAREAGDWDGSRVRLEAALDAAPADAEALRQALWTDLGQTLLAAGRPEDARPALERAANLGKSAAGARASVLLGRALEALGRSGEALETYLRMGYLYSDDDPSVSEALVRAGDLVAAQGEADRSRPLYERAASGTGPWADTARERLAARSTEPPVPVSGEER